MHVRLETNAFEVGDAVRRQHVVEILGHRIWIETDAGADDLRRAEPQAAHRVFGAMDQIVGKLARFDLLGELLAVGRLENFVHERQQCSQC